MGIGIEGLTANANLPPTEGMTHLPLVDRPRVIVDEIGINPENYALGQDIIASLGLDESTGRLMVGNNRPGSPCTPMTLAEALVAGHGGITEENLRGTVEDAKAENIDLNKAVVGGLRVVLLKRRDSEDGPDQLMEAPKNIEGLKKNKA